MRKRLFEIIEVSKDNDLASSIYDAFMMIIIILSLIPLTFKETTPLFIMIDRIAVIVFILDYIARLITADYKLQKGAASFVKYPFTFAAIIDLLAILPSFNILASGFRVFKLFRLFRTFRVLRVFRMFKIFRYSKNVEILLHVMEKQKDPLIAVIILAIAYIFMCALVIFNVEPATFDNFYEAIYWATVSLTTMGYGDIYPVSAVGRFITMISAVVGIAIVALPAGIITAGYMDEIQKNRDKDE